MKNIILIALSILTLSSYSQTTTPTDSSNPPAIAAPAVSMHAVATPDDSTGTTAAATLTVSMDSQGFVSIMIPQTQQRDVQRDWVKYAGHQSKGKAVIVNGDNVQYGATNKNISPGQFDISCRLLGSNDGVRTTVWLTDINSLEVSKELIANRNIALQKYVRDFGVQEYRQAVLDQMKAEQQKQAGMENQLAKLVKDEEKASMKAEENKRSIIKANDAILVNNRDIQSMNAQIESQKGMVESIASDANASKGAKKTLAEKENDKRSIQKSNDRLGKNIETWKNEIRASEKIIADDQQKEATGKVAIENQKQIIMLIKTKLDGIK